MNTISTKADFAVVPFIETKRNGQPHPPGAIQAFIDAMMAEQIEDYQISAWLMAVCCQGLSLPETIELTRAMVHSGQCIAFDEALRPVIDKHSTGGVGDKTTLVLMPMLAACGYHVAKLSGRGLGFTGGTADKLEAIPGFQVNLSLSQLQEQASRIGIALGSQSQDLAPADAKLYALRDVTGTVSSIELITASIVSKKIAAGADVIVLDIKCGQGAFMQDLQEAQALAASCRAAGEALGRPLSTLISSMDQPLGDTIGHTLEVIEAIDTLNNRGPKDLTDLCVALGAKSLCLANLTMAYSEAEAAMKESLSSGKALELFRQLIIAQGGDAAVVENVGLMPHPKEIISIPAPMAGVVQECYALQIAKAAKLLGAGRQTKADQIDLSVGVKLYKKVGDALEAGDTLAELWVQNRGIEAAKAAVLAAYRIEAGPCPPTKLVLDE